MILHCHVALAVMLFATGIACTTSAAPRTLSSVGPDKLPRWRGFNLLEKFSKDWSNKPFVEEDFKVISALGFNFVRLPLDYRTWIKDGDWTQFDEDVLKEIDQAEDQEGHIFTSDI